MCLFVELVWGINIYYRKVGIDLGLIWDVKHQEPWAKWIVVLSWHVTRLCSWAGEFYPRNMIMFIVIKAYR